MEELELAIEMLRAEVGVWYWWQDGAETFRLEDLL